MGGCECGWVTEWSTCGCGKGRLALQGAKSETGGGYGVNQGTICGCQVSGSGQVGVLGLKALLAGLWHACKQLRNRPHPVQALASDVMYAVLFYKWESFARTIFMKVRERASGRGPTRVLDCWSCSRNAA